MNKELWQAKGIELAQNSNTSAWAIADWIVAAHDGVKQGGNFDTYADAARILNWACGSVRNYASVASAFPPAERHNDMTFGHHVAVAGLRDKQKQHRLLTCAAAENVSVAKLRDEVRKIKGQKPKKKMEFFLDGLSYRDTEIMRELAHLDGVSLVDFVKKALVAYVNERQEAEAARPDTQVGAAIAQGRDARQKVFLPKMLVQ